MTPELGTALQQTAGDVEALLDRLVPGHATLERRIWESMRYSLMAGGKRLRPFLVTASADIFHVPVPHCPADRRFT